MVDDRFDPPRLLDSAEDERLLSALRSGVSETASPAQMELVASKLAGILAPPAVGAGVGAGAGKVGAGLASGVFVKSTILVLGVGLAGATAIYVRTGDAPGPAMVESVATAPTFIEEPATAPVAVDPAPAVAASYTAAPEPVVSRRPPDRATDPPIRANAPPPRDVRESEERPAEAASEPASSSTSAREPEAKLLARAQSALRSDPGEALSLATEHATSYPGGLLAQEREVIAIEALTRLSRLEEARLRARRFRSVYPGSTHLGRIEVLVGKY